MMRLACIIWGINNRGFKTKTCVNRYNRLSIFNAMLYVSYVNKLYKNSGDG